MEKRVKADGMATPSTSPLLCFSILWTDEEVDGGEEKRKKAETFFRAFEKVFISGDFYEILLVFGKCFLRFFSSRKRKTQNFFFGRF
jgi:hypothetical protein